MNNLLNSDNLRQTQFMIGEKQFTILPLSAFEGFKLLEYIRENIGFNLLQFDSESLGSSLASLIATKAVYVDHVRKVLFSKVSFRTLDSKVSGMLSDININQAFEDCQAFDIYELLLRCVYVNFFSTFDRVSKLLDNKPQPTA